MIGIIGGYGNIGLHTVRFLSKLGITQIRIGGRNVDSISNEIRSEFSNAEWISVDVSNKDSIRNFFNGCSCVLDATSTLDDNMKNMDDVAEDMGIPLAHLGINGFSRSNSKVPILYGSGSIPGLSGLIPQYLASEFDSVSELDFVYGTCSAISKAAARDYMNGILSDTNHSMIYWKNGKLEPYIPSQCKFEIFRQKFSTFRLYPFFDDESRAVAEKLKPEIGIWQMCIIGKRTLEELDSARESYRKNPDKTIERLCTANKLDLFGVKEDAVFACSIKGMQKCKEQESQIIISGIGASRLTGECAAATVFTMQSVKMENKKSLLGETSLFKNVIDLINKDSDIRIKKSSTSNDPVDELEGEI